MNYVSMWSHAISKAKALPLITYVCTFMFVSRYIITTIDKIVYKLVWKNKHYVTKTLIANPVNGGLKMLDTEAVTKANKLNFIKRILT